MRSSTADKILPLLLVAVLSTTGLCREAQEKDYAPFPKPDAGYITDLAGLLSYEQEENLERLLYETERRNGVEIIVVIIDSLRDYPGTPNGDIETFARALFDTYGIGNLPRNDGVLLLIAHQDRKLRIELGARYGHARDRKTRRIIDREILPSFRKDAYAQGITRGVKALIREFGGLMLLPAWLPWLLAGIALGLIPVAISLFKNGKRGWGWIVIGLIVVLLLAVFWLMRQAATHLPRGGSGGLGAGGLGGFGGGFSGGGGATGSW